MRCQLAGLSDAHLLFPDKIRLPTPVQIFPVAYTQVITDIYRQWLVFRGNNTTTTRNTMRKQPILSKGSTPIIVLSTADMQSHGFPN